LDPWKRRQAPELSTGETLMMVLLGYFLVAAIAGIAASAIVGLILTNLVIRRFTKAERPMNVSCASAVNEENEESLWRSRLTAWCSSAKSEKC
jgi:hypothetical protein